MNWELDGVTVNAADRYPLNIDQDCPAAQFKGRNFNPENWNNRVIGDNPWPDSPILSSPQTIIQQFVDGHYLNGLALVVSWGTMWRQNNRIYGNHDLQVIHDALAFCAQNLIKTETINESWLLLTGIGQGQLAWSPVITSKTLHFLSRSVGFEQDPPVAIDNAVILKLVWPYWRNMIPINQRPQGWRGKDLESYLRYMTAINVWAQQRHWTTTQMEATIFAAFRNRAQQTSGADGVKTAVLREGRASLKFI